jgi:hypothetical protein
LLGGYVASSGKNATSTRTTPSRITGNNLVGWSYGRDNSSESSLDKAKQIERYLNYLLEHPALCTSFPLNVILKVRALAETILWICCYLFLNGYLYAHAVFLSYVLRRTIVKPIRPRLCQANFGGSRQESRPSAKAAAGSDTDG